MVFIYNLYYNDYNGPPIYNYYDKYIKPKLEEREMAKVKRPPMKWDSRNEKLLSYTWGLYNNSDYIPNVIAYDIEECWYIWQNELGVKHRVEGVNFCVKRLG